MFHGKKFCRIMILLPTLIIIITGHSSLWSVDVNETNIIGGSKGATAQPSIQPEVGDIRNDVNLFTGDVNFTHNLTTLSGIGGLDITLGLTYNSNIHNLLYTKNKYSQASWVGLGWTLTFGYIKADLKGTRAIYDDEYTLITEDGSSHKLVERESNLFDLKDYKFWQMERILLDTAIVDTNTVSYIVGWKIIKEDGTVFYYGDFQYGYGPLKSNRCRLAWEDWIGDGYVDTLQNLVCYQWDLSKVISATRKDSIVFEYYQHQEYLSNGTWTSAYPYTKASYISKIYDSMGRTIEFHLEDRQDWEIQDPYTYYPEPDGFQEFYETKRLNEIVVKDMEGEVFQKFEFKYNPIGVGLEDRKKVLLESITQKGKSDIPLPSTRFEYYTSSADTNYGALKNITYPTGGSVEYTYGIKEIEFSRLDTSFFHQDQTNIGLCAAISPNMFLKCNLGLDSNVYYACNWTGRWQKNDSKYGYMLEFGAFNDGCTGDNYYAYSDRVEYFPVVAWRWEGSRWRADTLRQIVGGWPNLFSLTGSDNFFLIKKEWQSGTQCFAARWEDNNWRIDTVANTLDKGYGVGREMIISNAYNGAGRVIRWNEQTKAWDTFDYGNMSFQITCGNNYFVGSGQEAGDRKVQPAVWTGRDFRWWKIGLGGGDNNWYRIYPGMDYFVMKSEDHDDSWWAGQLYGCRYNGYGFNFHYLSELGRIYFAHMVRAVSTNQKDGFVVGYKRSSYPFPIYEVQWIRWDGEQWQIHTLYSASQYEGVISSVDCSEDLAIYYIRDSGQLWACRWTEQGIQQPECIVNLGGRVDSVEIGAGDDYCVLLAKTNNNLWVCRWNGESWIDTMINCQTPINNRYYPWVGAYPDHFVFIDKMDTNGIHLYKWSENKFTGNMKDYPVIAKTTDDGFGNTSTWTIDYQYGIYDETNNYAKYNKVTVTLPGNNGYVEYFYYNDLSSGDGPFPNLDDPALGNGYELDGCPYAVNYYDSSGTYVGNDWYVWYAWEKEYSCYYNELLSLERWSINGVDTRTEYGYSGMNGLPSSIKEYQDSYNTRWTYITWAYEVYPEMRNKHMLSQVYKKEIREYDFPPGKTRSCSITKWSNQYGDTNQWFPCSHYEWKDEDQDADIDEGELIRIDSIYSYDSHGNVLELADANGNMNSYKYGYGDKVPVASVSNARYSEISAVDFEEGVCEDDGWWSYGPYNVDTIFCHTGEKSCHFDSNFYELGMTKTIYAEELDTAGKYVFSAWVKTVGENACLYCKICFHSSPWVYGGSIHASGKGDWEYLELKIDLNQYSDISHIVLRAANGMPATYGHPECWWDDLRFHPKDALMTTKTYDQGTLNIRAKLDENSMPVKFEHDEFGRLREKINAINEVVEEKTYYYSREGSFTIADVIDSFGFEDSTYGDWEHFGGYITNYDSHSGRLCAWVHTFLNASLFRNFSPDEIDTNRSYAFSIWVKNTYPDAGLAQYTISYAGGDSAVAETIWLSNDFEWELLQLQLDLKNYSNITNVFISIETWEPGGAYCDDIYFHSLGDGLNPDDPNYVQTITYANGNLIRDGSFEWWPEGLSPHQRGWNKYNWGGSGDGTVSSSDESYIGKKSVFIQNDGNSQTGLFTYCFLDSGTYTISLYAKKATDDDIMLKMYCGDGYSPEIPLTTSWERYSFTKYVPPSAPGVAREFNFQCVGYDGSMYVDNVVAERCDTASSPIVQTTYQDGLGRTIQTQVVNGNKDIATNTEYDELGRVWKTYKPYEFDFYMQAPTGHKRHAFDTEWRTRVQEYYDGLGEDEGPDCGGYPYVEKVYMNDPYGWVSEIGNPGTDFNRESGHSMKYSYRHATYEEFPGQHYLRVITTTDENGVKNLKYIDRLGNTYALKADSGGYEYVTINEHDIMGNLVKVIPPKANQDSLSPYNSTYEYNTLGQLIKKQTPDDGVTQYIYDHNGNLIYSQDQKQSHSNHFTVRYYDPSNRLVLVGVEQDQTYDWSTSYPPVDDTTFGKDPDEWRVRYYYDQDYIGDGANYCKGKLTKEETHSNYSLYKYDKFGNIIEKRIWISGLGEEIIKFEYDVLNRLTKLIYPDGSVVSYTYDPAGRLHQVGDETDPGKYATYTYFANGLRNTVILGNSAQTVNYKYNPRDWMISINDGAAVPELTGTGDHFGLTLTYTFGGYQDSSYYNGNVASMTWAQSADGAVENDQYKYGYDAINRLTNAEFVESPTLGVPSTSPAKINQRSIGNPQDKHKYDAIGRHTKAKLVKSSVHSESYSYDPNSNLISLTRGGVVHEYDYYENNNQLKHVSNWLGQKDFNYLYDANGNMTQDSSKVMTISYDYRNMPIHVYLKKFMWGSWRSDILDFEYDGSGRRVKKRHLHNYYGSGECCREQNQNQLLRSPGVPGDSGALKAPAECICKRTTETYYIYSGDNVIIEYNADGTWRNKYILAGNDLIAIRRKGRTGDKLSFLLKDHLGSTRVMVDSTGTVQAKYTYYPFGDELSTWMSEGTDYKFTGKEFDDESGFRFYYFGARYYEPRIGRWFSVDPRDQYISPYVYCGNNPLLMVDETGEFSLLLFAWPVIMQSLYVGLQTHDISATMQAFTMSAVTSAASMGLGAGLNAVLPKASNFLLNVARSASIGGASSALTGGMLNQNIGKAFMSGFITGTLGEILFSQQSGNVSAGGSSEYGTLSLSESGSEITVTVTIERLELDPYGVWVWLPGSNLEFPVRSKEFAGRFWRYPGEGPNWQAADIWAQASASGFGFSSLSLRGSSKVTNFADAMIVAHYKMGDYRYFRHFYDQAVSRGLTLPPPDVLWEEMRLFYIWWALENCPYYYPAR